MLPHEGGGETERVEDPQSDAVPARVLIAEDDDALRSMARLVLQLAGYQVLVAEDGDAALALLDGDPIDLLVTDVRMPGAGGPHLAQKLREHWPQLKVLYMSGYSTVDVPQDELSIFLEKPFAAEVLVREAARLLKL